MTPARGSEPAGGASESGFTLVEVMISVLLLTLIMGALSAAFVTSMRLSSDTLQHTKESNDAQLIAGYLGKDAQAAGATDAITGQVDSKYGIAIGDATGCEVASGDPAVVRFEWLDRPTAVPADRHNNISVYYYVPPTGTLVGQSGHLVRQTCVDGTAVTSTNVLARNVPTQPTATCDPACTASAPLPSTVSLTVDELQTNQTPNSPPTHYTYTLTASTCPEGQPATPPNATGAPSPLVLLGDDACNGAAPLSGTTNVPVTVYGTAFIEGGAANCDAYNLDDYTAKGGTEAIAPARCPAGATDCTNIAGITARDPHATGLTAPTPSGPGRAGCDGPGVYAGGMTIAGGVCTLAGGVYYLQGDLTVEAGATLDADAGVLIYLEHGHVSIAGKLIASPIAGQYDGVVLWQAAADTNALATTPGANVHFNGTVYAPGAAFNVTKGIAMKALVAQGLSYGPTDGVGVSQIGLVTPTEITMTPDTLDQVTTPTNETITIDGRNFVDTPTVAFSDPGIHVNNVNFVSADRITVEVRIDPAANLGKSNVTITNPNGGIDIEEQAFTVAALPTITSVTLANGAAPNVAGTIEAGDTITVVFSKQIRESSICTAWVDDNANQVLNGGGDVTVTANDGGTGINDTIGITSVAGCNLAPAGFGTIDLGAEGYVTGNASVTFSGDGITTTPSKITWTASTRTLVVTLGTQAGTGVPAPVAQSMPTYTSPPRFTDTLGGAVTPPTFTVPNNPQF